MAADLEGSTTTNSIHQPNRPQCSFGFHWIAPWLGPQLRAADLCSRLFKRPLYCFSNSSMRVPRDALAIAARSPPVARRHLHGVWTAARRPTHGAFALALGAALCNTADHVEKAEADSRATDRAGPIDAAGDRRVAGERPAGWARKCARGWRRGKSRRRRNRVRRSMRRPSARGSASFHDVRAQGCRVIGLAHSIRE
jgi:hypothetical protein